jgi:hypothetical protein
LCALCATPSPHRLATDACLQNRRLSPGNYGGDGLNQGGGAPAAAFGDGNYGADNDASAGKLDDLLSDLKFDVSGKEDVAVDAKTSDGQDDLLDDDFKAEDVAEDDYVNKRS